MVRPLKEVIGDIEWFGWLYSPEYNCLSSSLSRSMQLLKSSLLGSPDITIER